jgi:signal transduction histidine kinase
MRPDTAGTRSAPGGLLTQLFSGSAVVRLTVTMSALIVAACLVLSLVQIRHGLEDHGRMIGEFVAREAEIGVLSGDLEALRQLGSVATAERDVLFARFLDKENKLLMAVQATQGWEPDAEQHDTAPAGKEQDVYEVRAPITTVSAQLRREELGFTADGHPARQARTPLEQVGTVVVAMALRPYQEQRSLALRTAGLFSALITSLAVLSTLLLTLGPLRALASAAELAAEHERVAELRTRFVTMASHEFGHHHHPRRSDVLQRYSARLTVEKQQGRLQKIRNAVRQMTDLLDDVLAFGRAEAGGLLCTPERVDLESLCQELVADAQVSALATHRLLLSFRGPSREGTVDPKLVRQTLRNLLANAVKYSPEGGTVELEVHSGNGSVQLRVADQGIGIPPEDLPHLFEPFQRAANVGKIEGSGLGLAIAHRAVRAHGGTITVHSVVGRGTTFVVELPPKTCAPADGGRRR